MKRIAWYTALVLTTITVLILLWQFREALLLFLLSLAIAAAFRPGIVFLTSKGVPRGIALILVYFTTLALIGGLLFALGGPLINDLQHATNDFISAYERVITHWPEEGTMFQRTIAAQLPPLEDLYASLTGEEGQVVIQSAMGFASTFFGLASNLSIILILSIYWSADSVRFERLWLSLIPGERRARARSIWRATESGVGSYIRSRFIQSLVVGVLLWLGFQVIGLKYPALLALVGAFTRLIPWVGAVVGLFPPFLVGLQSGPGAALLAMFYFLAILVIMELVLTPRFFPRQDYSNLLIVLVAIALAEAFGLIGLILAPALAVAIQIIFENSVQFPTTAAAPQVEVQPATGISPYIQEIDQLRERLDHVRDTMETSEEAPSAEVSSLMERLNQLMEKTNTYLRTGLKA